MKDVCVKAKAKMGKMPTEDIYKDLIATSDLNKKLNILQRLYPFIDYRQDKKTIEALNFKLMYDELKSLDYFLEGLESDFFNLYFSKHEILYLQEIIESLVYGNFSNNYIYFLNAPMADNYNLSPSMNLESFIIANKDSPYYRILLPFINRNMREDSVIFLSSNALVKFYYRSLVKMAKKFPKKHAKLIENFLGEEINLQNFEMLYRLKTSYRLDDNDIFNYLIEGGNKFNGTRLKEISMLKREDFIDFLDQSKYRHIFNDSINTYMHKKRYQLKLYKAEIRKSESDILYIISAMNIIFMSGEDIRSLLELDDDFSQEEKLEYLIMR